jgi:hypothetical protein
VGYTLINVVTSVASIAMTYVMDSYFEVAAEALLLINGMSKVIAWAFTYGFVPWTTRAGYESVRSLLHIARLSRSLLICHTGLWSNGRHLPGMDAPGRSNLYLWCTYKELYNKKTENYILVMECRSMLRLF